MIRRETLVILGYLAASAGFLLAFLAQRYWVAKAWKLAGRFGRAGYRKGFRIGLLVLLLGVAIVALHGIVGSWQGTISRGSGWIAFLGLWLSSSIVAYIFVKVIAAAEWIWRRLRPNVVRSAHQPGGMTLATKDSIDQSRRHFFQTAGFLAGAVPFVSAVYGFASERLRFEVLNVEIPIANLPPGLGGLRITQLSDIHIGSYMPVEQVRRAVGMANELGGELVVVTGDFLTGRTDPLEDCIAELSRLRSTLGVWGCNGNHEIYAGAEAESARLFDRFGMKLLRQENAEVSRNGNALNLIGVDYQRQRRGNGDREPMLTGVDKLIRRDVPNILMSHNPNSFPRAAELGIELSLAGHTHGGQVRVEILDHRWSPARFLTPYVAGLYRRPLLAAENLTDAEAHAQLMQAAPCHIYVNRGLGTIGAPVRLGVPPEITLLTLRRA